MRRARVSRASHAWQVRATQVKDKISGFAALRNFGYTTRANIAHEKAEQIRARKLARPLKVQGGRESNMYANGMELYFFILSIGYTWVFIL